MEEIGIVPAPRLDRIPARHRAKHEFCFHLCDLIPHLLVEMRETYAGWVSFKVENAEELAALQASSDVLDYLESSGRSEIAKRVVLNHTCMALFSDAAHFLHDGLIALEKRKFAVAFSLLRKPFKETSYLAAMLCADEDNFFNTLKAEPKNLQARNRQKDTVIELFEKAKSNCQGSQFVGPERIFEVCFNRSNPYGLAPLFDKALHLTTCYKAIETESFNLNFIFKDPLDDDIYESVYDDIAVTIYFLHIMQLELYRRMGRPRTEYIHWLFFTTLLSYEALFTSERGIRRFVNESFKQFLVCPHCEAKLSVRKRFAPRFAVAEVLSCSACGQDNHFPLRWLLSKLELTLP